jgi:hypothetical protein
MNSGVNIILILRYTVKLYISSAVVYDDKIDNDEANPERLLRAKIK